MLAAANSKTWVVTPHQREVGMFFSGHSVRAILRGEKTQTRRVLNPQPSTAAVEASICRDNSADSPRPMWHFTTGAPHHQVRNPHAMQPWAKGDLLWARESVWLPPKRITQKMLREGADTWAECEYDADLGNEDGEGQREHLREMRWQKLSPLLMRKDLARVWLVAEEVECERLLDITDAAAVAEGVEWCHAIGGGAKLYRDYAQKRVDTFEWFSHPRDSFRTAWDLLHFQPGHESVHAWHKNPWVWVVRFGVHSKSRLLQRAFEAQSRGRGRCQQ